MYVHIIIPDVCMSPQDIYARDDWKTYCLEGEENNFEY